MMKSATAVKAKIKNKAGGSSDKSQIMLRIYLMETLLAEKLETIMVRAEANTRMRDFYDIRV